MKATFLELWPETRKFHLSPRKKVHFLRFTALGLFQRTLQIMEFALFFHSFSHSRSTSKPCQQKPSILTILTIIWNEKAWNTWSEAYHSKQRKYQTGKTHLFSCSKANTTRGLHSISLSEIPISQYLVTQSECLTLSSCVTLKRNSALWGCFTCRSGQGSLRADAWTVSKQCIPTIEFLPSPSSEAAMGPQQEASETHSEHNLFSLGVKQPWSAHGAFSQLRGSGKVNPFCL